MNESEVIFMFKLNIYSWFTQYLKSCAMFVLYGIYLFFSFMKVSEFLPKIINYIKGKIVKSI